MAFSAGSLTQSQACRDVWAVHRFIQVLANLQNCSCSGQRRIWSHTQYSTFFSSSFFLCPVYTEPAGVNVECRFGSSPRGQRLRILSVPWRQEVLIASTVEIHFTTAAGAAGCGRR